ncbi:acyltransferase family protein [Priestia megaterium]|uniref:acyltransferase family protein n=1 Tax=Priestia megaterium TaxID=1404 RepID=UPI00301DDBA7
MLNKKRLVELDIVKGITIFLVVFGHAGASEGMLGQTLSAFRMPLFFLVSGYLFSNSKYLNNFKLLLVDKIRTLILPYFVFCLMSAIVWYFLSSIQNVDVQWGKPIFGMIYGNGNWIIGNIPIWFLPCLFCTLVIFVLIQKLLIKNSLPAKIIIFSLIGIAGYLISKISWMPWGLDVALVALPFVYLGGVLKEIRVLYNHKIMISATFLSLVVFIISLIYNTHVDMNNRIYGNLFLFYVGGISGAFVVLFLCKYILSKIKIVSLTFSYMGMQSILILGFHGSIGLNAVSVLNEKVNIGFLGNPLISSIIAISISLCLGLGINKIPLLSFLFKGTTISIKKSNIDSGKNVVSK